MKIYAKIILLICFAAILLFSNSCKEKESDKHKDIGYTCEDGSDSCTFARMCRGIKDIKEEHLKEIKACADICNGIEDTILICIPEIATIRDYPCKDGTDSCEIAKLKKELLESLDEILSKSKKERQNNRKFQCEVFGCDIPKDSSFLMLTDYYAFSRYNREYLLVSSDRMNAKSGFLTSAEEESVEKNYVSTYHEGSIDEVSQSGNNSLRFRLDDILSDCELNNISYSGENIIDLKHLFHSESVIFSADSKCDLAPLVTKLPKGTDFFCFYYRGFRSYTLMKEKGSIGKILKLKNDKLGIGYIRDSNTLNYFESGDYDLCLYHLGILRAKHCYDILYISNFDKPEDLCDLNRWHGVRLREQVRKNITLKSLFVAPKGCVSFYEEVF